MQIKKNDRIRTKVAMLSVDGDIVRKGALGRIVEVDEVDGAVIYTANFRGNVVRALSCAITRFFEKEVGEEVVFAGKKTILIKDGKEYVAECNELDDMDREKGVLLCFAKAHGITYKQLQKLIDEASVRVECLKNSKKFKITLSEFWKSPDELAIYCENDKQGKLLYDTMIDKGFYVKNNVQQDKYWVGYDCILNRKSLRWVKIEQAHKEFIKGSYKIFNFNEVDLNN